MIVTEQNHESHGLRVTAVRPADGAGLRTAVPRITVLYVYVHHGALRYVMLCANCAAHRCFVPRCDGNIKWYLDSCWLCVNAV